MRTRIVAPGELESFVGSVIGVRPWVTVDQPTIDAFADVTSDRQWIHTDPRRAAAGPFGVTIAHGYLALSLVTSPMNDAFDVDGSTMAVNYGSIGSASRRWCPSGPGCVANSGFVLWNGHRPVSEPGFR